MRNRKGFTLIELLVVIAIIAVLISMLVRRAKGACRRCPHHVRKQHEATGAGLEQLADRQSKGTFGGNPTNASSACASWVGAATGQYSLLPYFESNLTTLICRA